MDKRHVDNKKDNYFRPLVSYNGKKPFAPDWFNNEIAKPYMTNKIVVKGVKINWLAWGTPNWDIPKDSSKEKQTIFFIHGGRANAKWWQFFAAALSQTYYCLSIDLSGMGDSGNAPFYSIDNYANEVLQVIKHLKLSKPIIVGHSFGAAVALQVAQKSPQLIKSIILVDIFLGLLQKENGYHFIFREESNKMGTNIYAKKEDAIKRFRLLPNQDCKNHFFIDFMARENLRQVKDKDGNLGYQWKYDTNYGEPVEIKFRNDILCKPPVTTDYIFGEDSFFYPEHAKDFFKNEVPEGTILIAIKKAAHHVLLDQPRLLLEKLNEIVKVRFS